ncbi:hypothetical protein [Accumulibacter sp.]|uniref:hypothetical protein n=1 Tax=Accumulibacter sp. TaxID=2053492 RepID=UPI0025DE36E2|nr:hypothetical protein [Accumulibacter sp.]MCM8595774.1 hypothetical protein [Accumulibacter sp.]MCM8626496.1 hypothetical protein [Accumulibacter sp.]MDS4049922.1 hypothetical protein [Accumulibacter sp.]
MYVLWAGCSIGFALIVAGLSPESVTRILVLGFLAGQLLALPLLGRFLPRSSPRHRFVVLAMFLAAAVEGFHMISSPVFASLIVTRATPPAQALANYALDLLFTLPAYLVIFTVIWLFISRHHFPLWAYVLIVGFAQTIGDGGLFYFAGAPAMLAFLPYPMSNYHAINVLPFLAVRGSLRSIRPLTARSYLVIPVIVAAYLASGALIRAVGRLSEFE